MLPSMDPRPRKAVKTRPHLVLKARPGWRFDSSQRTFVSTSASEDSVSVEDAIPKHAEVVPRVPTARPEAESDTERDLACYWSVLVSARDDLQQIASELRGLKCVEKVDFPPEVSLPTDMYSAEDQANCDGI